MENDLQLYLDNLLVARKDLVSSIEALRLIWKLIQNTVGAFPIPVVYPVDDGGMGVSWINKGHSLSLDVFSKTDWNWFRKEQGVNMTEYEEVNGVVCLPTKLIEQLKIYQQS